MREIKFRAWDGKKMHNVERVDIAKTGVRCYITARTIAYHYGYVKIENAKLMQYTGLKDKNGVDIYEGDIVNYYIDEDRTDVDKVVWWEDFSGFALDSYALHLGEFSNEDIEVIGNIYESPNLLK